MRAPSSIIIDRPLANRTLLEVVQSSFHLPRQKALDALRNRHVLICGGACIDPQRRVKAGQHIQLLTKSNEATKSCESDLGKQVVVRHVSKIAQSPI